MTLFSINPRRENQIRETVTITGIETFSVGGMARYYYLGATRDGETVGFYLEGQRNLILNCLTLRRIERQPVTLTLLDCSDRYRGRYDDKRFPGSFQHRKVFCKDARFADALRQDIYNAIRSDTNFTVGSRMDDILSGGEALAKLARKWGTPIAA